MKIFGFSFVRNAFLFDYPFSESIHSLLPLVDKMALVVGEGEDQTLDFAQKLPKTEMRVTQWDTKAHLGGQLFSQQTNMALAMTKEMANEKEAWGLYLQADEVLNEEDYPQIIQDFHRATELGCDAIRFRYFHFWKTHHAIAISKKWYPQEIRAVKLSSEIESWGDAQGFRGAKKIYDSDVAIFHYGHVRNKSQYKLKKKAFRRFYRKGWKLWEFTLRDIKEDLKTRTLPYLGTHPQVMKQRIIELGDQWHPDSGQCLKEVLVDGLDSKALNNFSKKVIGANLKMYSPELYHRQKFGAVIRLRKISFWEKLASGDYTPTQMKSPLARPWPKETLLTLKLSGFGIGLKKLED